MMELLGQPIEKTHWVMHKWGYTGSPCVIMALDDAINQGRGPKPGDKLCSAPVVVESAWQLRLGSGYRFETELTIFI